MTHMMKIGIVGAGMIGGTLGRLWFNGGHEVRFGTRNSEALQPLIAQLGSKARAGSAQEAAEFGEIVLFAAPFAAWPGFADEHASILNGKTVIDAANPYPQRDGEVAESAARSGLGSTGFAAQLVPQAHTIKAFNTIYYAELAAQAHRSGEKLAIPMAGNHLSSLDLATGLAADAGFDSVVVGDLPSGRQLEPGNPAYGKSLTAAELTKLLGLK